MKSDTFKKVHESTITKAEETMHQKYKLNDKDPFKFKELLKQLLDTQFDVKENKNEGEIKLKKQKTISDCLSNLMNIIKNKQTSFQSTEQAFDSVKETVMSPSFSQFDNLKSLDEHTGVKREINDIMVS